MPRLTSYSCTCILEICHWKQKYTAYLASVFGIIKVKFNYEYCFFPFIYHCILLQNVIQSSLLCKLRYYKTFEPVNKFNSYGKTSLSNDISREHSP